MAAKTTFPLRPFCLTWLGLFVLYGIVLRINWEDPRTTAGGVWSDKHLVLYYGAHKNRIELIIAAPDCMEVASMGIGCDVHALPSGKVVCYRLREDERLDVRLLEDGATILVGDQVLDAAQGRLIALLPHGGEELRVTQFRLPTREPAHSYDFEALASDDLRAAVGLWPGELRHDCIYAF